MTCLRPQRRAHQRPDPLLQQDRVDHLRVVDLSNDHRAALGRDPPGETPPTGIRTP